MVVLRPYKLITTRLRYCLASSHSPFLWRHGSSSRYVHIRKSIELCPLDAVLRTAKGVGPYPVVLASLLLTYVGPVLPLPEQLWITITLHLFPTFPLPMLLFWYPCAHRHRCWTIRSLQQVYQLYPECCIMLIYWLPNTSICWLCIPWPCVPTHVCNVCFR